MYGRYTFNKSGNNNCGSNDETAPPGRESLPLHEQQQQQQQAGDYRFQQQHPPQPRYDRQASGSYVERQREDESTYQQSLQNQRFIDEAYRRLGHRLSQRVHTTAPAVDGQHYAPLILGNHSRAAFSYVEHKPRHVSSQERSLEHRQHSRGQGRGEDDSILKKLTVHSKAVYRSIQKSASYAVNTKYSTTSTTTSSAQTSAHGKVSLLSSSLQEEPSSSSSSNSKDVATKGLMRSALEGRPAPARKKCLTHPSESISNEGKDNAEGNLICYEGDLIQPTHLKTLHSTAGASTIDKDQGSRRKIGVLRVLKLLGQGTFAQVFGVECLETGTKFALKVVKNKQAYTRQATIEIDVFRALQFPLTKRRRVVELEAYFVYANHLCLVFEWLGPNLYEILKERQFRGLPLDVVKTLLKQAMEGLRELEQKSIVHCDVKPENILLHPPLPKRKSGVAPGARILNRKGIDIAEMTKPKNTSERNLNHGKEQDRKPDATDRSSNEVGQEGQETGINTKARNKTSSVEEKTNSIFRSPSSSGQTRKDPLHHLNNEEAEVEQMFRMKLIDFGSACIEGVHTNLQQYTYIQSRFYRSPEVLLGLSYDSAIDMWSLGCVAAELFLGLPILPGVQEHDQIERIAEMMGPIPGWMLEQGTKSPKFFVKEFQSLPVQLEGENLPTQLGRQHSASSTLLEKSQGEGNINASKSLKKKIKWRLKTTTEYIQSLSPSELRKKGGKAALVSAVQQQDQNRYFRRTRLEDIIILHGRRRTENANSEGEQEELLMWFVHLLQGMLDPDPWKRWTAYQASQHPFFTSTNSEPTTAPHTKDNIDKSNNKIRSFDVNTWVPPWDPSICQRKLAHVQKTRERQRYHQEQQQQQHQQQLTGKSPSTITEEEKASFIMGAASGSTSCATKTTVMASDAVSSLRSSRQSGTSIDRTSSPPSSLLGSFRHPSVESSLESSSFVTSRTHQSQQRVVPSSFSVVSNPTMNPGLSYGDNPSYSSSIAAGAIANNSLNAPHSYTANTIAPNTLIEQTSQQMREFGYALSRPGVLPSFSRQNSMQHHPAEEEQLLYGSMGRSFPNAHTSSLQLMGTSPTRHIIVDNRATTAVQSTTVPMMIRPQQNFNEHITQPPTLVSNKSHPNPAREPPPALTANKSNPYPSRNNNIMIQQPIISSSRMRTRTTASSASSLLAQQLEEQARIQQRQQQQIQRQQWYPDQQQISYGVNEGYYRTSAVNNYTQQQPQQNYYHQENPHSYHSSSDFDESVYSNSQRQGPLPTNIRRQLQQHQQQQEDEYLYDHYPGGGMTM